MQSCIIARLMKTDEFPEKTFSEQCWTHNLIQLLGLAGLQAAFKAAGTADPQLLANWGIVKDWNEAVRYTRKTKAKALRLYHAITDKKHGVLPWIMSRW